MSDSAALGFFSSLGRHPKGFWFIFWGELAERCSYYGMRAILALYMTDLLGFTKGEAGMAMSIFIGACYYLPLIGGWVADNYLGKYWTIVIFSIPYILGHFVLGIESVPFMVTALALLAMGTGVTKPNISSLMGMTYDQQRPGDEALRSDAFGIFYMAINIGATISQFAMPYIRTEYSYKIAFMFPAILMVIAFFFFAAGKKLYAVEKVMKAEDLSAEQRHNRDLIKVLIVLVGAIFAAATFAGIKFPDYSKWVGLIGFVAFVIAMVKVLGRLGGIFSLVTFFWAIFDQSASTWIFFAQKDFNLEVFGKHIEPDSIQAVNGFLIIILVPTFAVLWRVLAKRNLMTRATDRMLLGFGLTASTMLVMGLAGFVAMTGVKVNILWQVVAYIVLTCAEVCISVVGLELSFAAAEKHMKSVVTACWLLCVAIANLCINAPITQLYDTMAPGWYFSMLTVMMVPAGVIFAIIARPFNEELAAKKAKNAAEERPAAPPADAVPAS